MKQFLLYSENNEWMLRPLTEAAFARAAAVGIKVVGGGGLFCITVHSTLAETLAYLAANGIKEEEILIRTAEDKPPAGHLATKAGG